MAYIILVAEIAFTVSTFYYMTTVIVGLKREGCRGVENDRNLNICYLPKPNILLKHNYSATGRIAEYRIVPTQ